MSRTFATADITLDDGTVLPGGNGCDLHPDCFSCPLPQCRYELPPRRAGALLRAEQVIMLRAEGFTADQVAKLMHLSRRSVFRLTRRAADLPPPPG